MNNSILVTPRTVGVMAATTPFLPFNSSSRSAMLCNHIRQAVTPVQSDIPLILTGYETTLQAYNYEMPEDSLIIDVIPKYRQTYICSEIPEITIIYQRVSDGTYDCMTVPLYGSNHDVFGLKYNLTQALINLRPGTYISQGEKFAISPNVKEHGVFSNSLRVNMLNLAVPSVAEDGFEVSEDFCNRARPLIMQTIEVKWGSTKFPINTYGDINNFLPFPKIGDRVRADGVIMALRQYDDLLDGVTTSNSSLMQIDYVNDTLICTDDAPGALIYDIEVLTGIPETKAKPRSTENMSKLAELYVSALSEYYKTILTTYDTIQHKNKRARLSPALNQLIVRALADKPNARDARKTGSGLIQRTYKRDPLDEYNLRISYCYYLDINIGSKMTGMHGSKGVNCKVTPTELMPIDSEGNRVDMIQYEKAVIGRLNEGQYKEGYIGAVIRDLTKWIKANKDTIGYDVFWKKLLSFYEVVTPKMYEAVKLFTVTQITEHINGIINDSIYIILPIDCSHLDPTIISKIEKIHRPCYSRLTIWDPYYKKYTQTECNALVGVQQVLVLEKSHIVPMAIASSQLTGHGLISSGNKANRNANPVKIKPTRTVSESEARYWAAQIGARYIALILVMNNSPELHKDICSAILTADNPFDFNIEDLNVDLETFRPLRFIKHLYFCLGIELKDI
jgi:hypothetical protein